MGSSAIDHSVRVDAPICDPQCTTKTAEASRLLGANQLRMGARKIRYTADDADPRRCNRYLIKHTGASDPREGYIVGTKPLMSLGEQLHLMPDEPLACRLLLFVSPVLRKSNEDLVAELILIDHKNRKYKIGQTTFRSGNPKEKGTATSADAVT